MLFLIIMLGFRFESASLLCIQLYTLFHFIIRTFSFIFSLSKKSFLQISLIKIKRVPFNRTKSDYRLNGLNLVTKCMLLINQYQVSSWLAKSMFTNMENVNRYYFGANNFFDKKVIGSRFNVKFIRFPYSKRKFVILFCIFIPFWLFDWFEVASRWNLLQNNLKVSVRSNTVRPCSEHIERKKIIEYVFALRKNLFKRMTSI